MPGFEPQSPTSTLPALAPIGRIGRYEVLGKLAVGGMAEVFLARTTGPREVSRYLVIKRLLAHVESDAAKIETLVREAKLTSRLQHPNLCAIHDFGEDEGSFFLVMEWVRGVSLREVIDRARQRGGIPLEIVARLFSWLGNALGHAHGATDDSGRPLGVVHRDVTPENVILGWNGVPKIIDFGIAKTDADPTKTSDGVLKGKLAYISPEQYRGEKPDARSDVFALALCAYEAVTGKPPLFARDTEFETVAAIVVDEEPPHLGLRGGEIATRIEEAIVRGLAKKREARWTSATEMAAAFEQALWNARSSVSEAEVSRWISGLFPERAFNDPPLDRGPLEPRVGQHKREREWTGMQLIADAELEAEDLSRLQRRRDRIAVLALVLVCLSSIAVILWVASGRPGF